MKPGYLKLFASLLYEVMTIIALALLSVAVYVAVVGDATNDPIKRLVLQVFIWGFLGAYYVVSWVKSGQSLAMRSWKLKVVPIASLQERNAATMTYSTATLRYVYATFSLLLFGVGFFYCLIRPNRQFLHDDLLKLKIVDLKQAAPNSSH